jgi:N-acylneuraminate cytidylyltransferase/CMP-N,N'-diacetyllegionaminic acid synthase
MKRLCTVCARGGSKGVKNKNLRLLLGKPLIWHTLEQARIANLFDVIAVSSDSDEILSAASDWGCEYLIKRPIELATDEAPKLPAIRHCVEMTEQLAGYKFDTLVDLDATSPLRITEDIYRAVQMVEKDGAENVITVKVARHSPYFNLVEIHENGEVVLSKPTDIAVERRQDSPKCYDMNGSVYVWRRSALFTYQKLFNPRTRALIMPEDRSVDIDSELDYSFVEMLMKARQQDNF